MDGPNEKTMDSRRAKTGLTLEHETSRIRNRHVTFMGYKNVMNT